MLYWSLVLLILILYNFVWFCKASFIIESVKPVITEKHYVPSVDNQSSIDQLLDLLRPFENLSSLPKNYPFTDEELQKYTQEYLSGLNNEDIYLDGIQLIQKYGYKVEVHNTTTSDGYVLPIIRIPSKGPASFFMHGLIASYQDWLTIGPKKCLPFLLADAGRDVWLGNTRCNSFGRKNVNMSSSDPRYCDNSFDEIGRIDLPAMIDYVLETTGQDNLTYIGHSQGTTVFFVMCSELLEYNKKINFMIAFSAVAWMKNIISPLIRIAAQLNKVLLIARALGITTIPPQNVTQPLTLALCGNPLLASTVCSNAAFLLCGFDYPQIDYEQSSVIFSHVPSGCTLKQIEHYSQLVVSGGFKQYDYGVLLNQQKYGSPTPPSYPVEKITVPIGIFYSYNDWLSNPIDVHTLYKKLQNVLYYIEIPKFNHLDYLFAKDVKTLLYNKALKCIEERVPYTIKS